MTTEKYDDFVSVDSEILSNEDHWDNITHLDQYISNKHANILMETFSPINLINITISSEIDIVITQAHLSPRKKNDKEVKIIQDRENKTQEERWKIYNPNVYVYLTGPLLNKLILIFKSIFWNIQRIILVVFWREYNNLSNPKKILSSLLASLFTNYSFKYI